MNGLIAPSMAAGHIMQPHMDEMACDLIVQIGIIVHHAALKQDAFFCRMQDILLLCNDNPAIIESNPSAKEV